MENLSSIIIAIACAIGFYFGVKVALRLVLGIKQSKQETWRDTPPFIFTVMRPIVQLISADVRPLMPTKSYFNIQQLLRTAGMYYAILPEEYVCMRLFYLVLGGAVSIYLANVYSPMGVEMLVVAIAAPFVLYQYPKAYLKGKAAERRRRVVRDFPFLLDLMVLSMRSGLNFSKAVQESVASLGPGPVKEEYETMLREIRAGKSRIEAHRDLATRLNVETIDNFVAALNQAEDTGGELVSILVSQAKQRRSERFMAAEEAAGKAPVKMLVPLMVFMFPVIFVLVGFVLLIGVGNDGLLPPVIWENLN